jgi:hypothetical protein
MPRPSSKMPPLSLPQELDATKLPRRASRQQMSEIHTFYFGPLSARTLADWPLQWHIVNGRAVGDVHDFLAEAQRRFDGARVVMGGRRATDQRAA